MREKRKKIWIDRFQTYLFYRIALYFVFYQIAVWTFVFIERSSYRALEAVIGEEGATYFIVFPVAIVVFVSFLFIYDAVKFAHRIVGPLYRFRKTMQAVLNGEDVELVVLRKGDFLVEMRDDMNEMLKLLEQRGVLTLKEQPNQPQKVSA